MSLPPPGDECPICFLILPSLNTGRRYMSCCGKFICRGCIYAGAWAFVGYDQLCSFCRTPASKSGEESIEWIKKRVKVDDAVSIHVLGCDYAAGRDGLSQDRAKALELWHRAAELGHAGAYHKIGDAYWYGRGVERDEKKATHYHELAALGENAKSRYNLGVFEAMQEISRGH